MLKRAEKICRVKGLDRVAIIAGVGTRGYYRDRGYCLSGPGRFMIKELSFWNRVKRWQKGVMVVIVVLSVFIIFLKK